MERNVDAGIALCRAVDDNDSSPEEILIRRYNEVLKDVIIRPISDSIVVAAPCGCISSTRTVCGIPSYNTFE